MSYNNNNNCTDIKYNVYYESGINISTDLYAYTYVKCLYVLCISLYTSCTHKMYTYLTKMLHIFI